MMTNAPLILLAVGDDQMRHRAGTVLAGRGYRVRLCSSAPAAEDIVREEPVRCAVLDATVAGPDRATLWAELARTRPEAPILLVQGDSSVRAALTAMSSGAREYLPGPLEPFALASALERVLSAVVTEAREPTIRAAEAAAARSPDEDTRESQQLTAAALEWLVRAMEAKDPNLPGHSVRVAELAATIATRMGRADWEVEEVRLAGRLHDIGMIAIGDGILTRAGPLTAAEYAEIRRHPGLGSQILEAYPGMARVASYVRGHHERWDGGGYPDGLAGAAIPWGARVLAAAETFDALTSNRSYRSARSVVEALERMYQVSADAIDPEVLRVLQRVVTRRETLPFLLDDDARAIEQDLLEMPEAVGHGAGQAA